MAAVNYPAIDFVQEANRLESKLDELEASNTSGDFKDTIIACRTGFMNLDGCSDKRFILSTIRESLDATTKQKPHLELVK